MNQSNHLLKRNICFENSCIDCCIETSMFLSKDDIDRIIENGHNPTSFIRKENGWMVLKNQDGRCVFHDGKKCLIYNIRPEGCKSYPLIYDDDYSIPIIDKDCPYNEQFEFQKSDIERLKDLIRQLKIQRKKNLLE